MALNGGFTRRWNDLHLALFWDMLGTSNHELQCKKSSFSEPIVLEKTQKDEGRGTSLAVQWLWLCAFNAEKQVLSLVRELRAHMPQGMGQKKKKKMKGYTWGTRHKHKDGIFTIWHEPLIPSLVTSETLWVPNNQQSHSRIHDSQKLWASKWLLLL